MLLWNLLRFVSLIGALVFVHELGHFLVAKLFGVKVLKFSLGFGPRLIGYRHLETDYCISLIPLGGFVRMLGEDPSDDVPPEDESRAFHAQSLWRRFLIVLAGPVMSLTFPVLLYLVVFFSHTDLTAPVIGTVAPGFPAEGRLFPGDRVVSIDGEPVSSFEAVREAIAAAPGRALRFVVDRGGAQPVPVSVTPRALRVQRPLDVVETVGMLGVAPGFALPVVGVREPATPASIAGLRSFDMITMYGGHPIRRWTELEVTLSHSRGATVPLAFLRPRVVENAAGGLIELEVFDPGLAQLTPTSGQASVIERTGIESPELYVADVDNDSPEHQMGLRRGARIIEVDGVAPTSWEQFMERLTGSSGHLWTVRFALDGREAVGGFTLRPTVWTDEFGQRSLRWQPGVTRWMPVVTEGSVPNPHPVWFALRNAIAQTWEALGFLALGLLRMIEGRVPIQSLGGPIMIYDASRAVGSDGWWGFLRLMALVSLNLGLVNFLPVPTLDGGHLLFFSIEAALRRPAPLWVRQTASVLGLILVLGVIVLAFRNDLVRRFEANPPTVLVDRP